MANDTAPQYPSDMPTKRYVSMNLEPATVEQARRLARWLSVEADRNVPLSEAISAAIAEAREHPQTLIARLTREVQGND
jgi:hypothetical protein